MVQTPGGPNEVEPADRSGRSTTLVCCHLKKTFRSTASHRVCSMLMTRRSPYRRATKLALHRSARHRFHEETRADSAIQGRGSLRADRGLTLNYHHSLYRTGLCEVGQFGHAGPRPSLGSLLCLP